MKHFEKYETFEQALRRCVEVKERDYGESGFDIWNSFRAVRGADSIHLSFLVENGWLEQIRSKTNPSEGTFLL